MNDFDFFSPTRFLFGRGQEQQVGALCRECGARHVLVHHGRSTAPALLDRVKNSLHEAGLAVSVLGGVQPNPQVALAREGIALCKEQGVDFILAVGGGSVIDSAKCIGVGALYDGDVWDFFEGAMSGVSKTLPVGCILTLAAAGSEGSRSCIMKNGAVKQGLNDEKIRPVFSILDPELCYTLPPAQTANGICDMMSHNMERYFTASSDVFLSDRHLEANMKTLVAYGPKALQNPQDYQARSALMWCGTLSHNNLFGVDRDQEWVCHLISDNVIGRKYDTAHGANLAVVTPCWMQHVLDHDAGVDRLAMFAVNVMGVENDFPDQKATAQRGIDALRRFFTSLGLPATLSELGVAPDEDLSALAQYAPPQVGLFYPVTPDDVLAILQRAAQ